MAERLNIRYLNDMDRITGIVSRAVLQGRDMINQTPLNQAPKHLNTYLSWRTAFLNWIRRLCGKGLDDLQEDHPSRVPVDARPAGFRGCVIGPDGVPEHQYLVLHLLLSESAGVGVLRAQFHNENSWTVKRKLQCIHEYIQPRLERIILRQCQDLILLPTDTLICVIYKLSYLIDYLKDLRTLNGNYIQTEVQLKMVLCAVIDGNPDYYHLKFLFRNDGQLRPDTIASAKQLVRYLRRVNEHVNDRLDEAMINAANKQLHIEFNGNSPLKRRNEDGDHHDAGMKRRAV